jgi:hypothetical protein
LEDGTLRILLLIFLIPYVSFAVMVNPESFNRKPLMKQSKGIKVVNVLIKKIEKNKIYSQNGKVFKLKKHTKIIKNYKNKPKIAELHFKNKELIEVILR